MEIAPTIPRLRAGTTNNSQPGVGGGGRDGVFVRTLFASASPARRRSRLRALHAAPVCVWWWPSVRVPLLRADLFAKGKFRREEGEAREEENHQSTRPHAPSRSDGRTRSAPRRIAEDAAPRETQASSRYIYPIQVIKSHCYTSSLEMMGGCDLRLEVSRR